MLYRDFKPAKIPVNIGIIKKLKTGINIEINIVNN